MDLSNMTPVHWTTSQLPSLAKPNGSQKSDNVANYRKQAEIIFKKDVDKAKLNNRKKMQGSGQWLETVLEKGASNDRIAAMVVLIQEDPIHQLHLLKSLVDLLAKDRRTALEVLQILRELFLTELLVPDRKLLHFEQQPFESLTGVKTELRNKYLTFWYFEDELKKLYFDFIKQVEKLSKDTVDSVRVKSTAVIFALLNGNPEQENYLLPCLINKIGDPSFKIASCSVHFLSKLGFQHPDMKIIIVKEMERMLYRSNISTKAQYYAMCFMNGLVLTKNDDELASYLLLIYFSFFKAYIKKGELESKMLSSLLVGVNRAMPFAKGNKADILKQTDILYKLIQVSKFNTSIQALILMYQIITISENASDRFYTALYQKLFDPDLQTSSKLNIFFGLISKCLKSDVHEKRVQAFIKRLLQMCLYLSPCFSCSVMLIISDLLKTKPQFKTTITTSEVCNGLVAEADNEETDEKLEDATLEKNVETTSSWHHLKNVSYRLDSYNPLHRNPIFCRADLDCAWELGQLARHYHPTVAIFANNLLQGENIVYSGDPLEDFGFRQFINRFISRNPKKTKDDKNETIMKSLGRKKGLKFRTKIDANNMGAQPQEDFMAKFYSHQQSQKPLKKKKDDDEESVESVSDSEFDDYLDKFEKGLEGGDVDVKYEGLPKNEFDSDDQESDLDDDLSDEEMDLGNLDNEFNVSDEDSNSDENNDDTDDEEIFDENPKKKRRKDVLFAAAEEYSDMIDEQDATENTKSFGSHEYARKNDANVKQLRWEKQRNFKLNKKSNSNKFKKNTNKRTAKKRR